MVNILTDNYLLAYFSGSYNIEILISDLSGLLKNVSFDIRRTMSYEHDECTVHWSKISLRYLSIQICFLGHLDSSLRQFLRRRAKEPL